MKIDCSAPCERDLDLVLMDLLAGWEGFGRWLASQLDGFENGSWQSLAHSVVVASSGESDLELSWQQTQGSVERLLIENKIDAIFQPRQAERYRERGQGYVDRGLCDGFRTLLVAPQAYLGDTPDCHGFDHTLSYEDVLGWVEQQSAAPQLRLKQELLLAAIDKRRRGYQPLADQEVTKFWRDCAAITALLHPQLCLRYDGSERPSQADALEFRPSSFPCGSVLWLRVPPVGTSYVQLLIAGAAEHKTQAVALLGELPSEHFKLVAAGKSLAVRMDIEPISVCRPLANQRNAVVAALESLEHLHGWALKRLDALEALLTQAST